MKSSKRIGDAPIETKFIKLMNDIAHVLDEGLNGSAKGDDKKVGFCLMVFPFHDHGGRCNYISNAERADVLVMLKEQVARWEGQPEVKGRA